MKENNVTIDGLARMIQKGFDETAKKDEVNQRFDKIDNRLDNIEKLILSEHLQRIE